MRTAWYPASATTRIVARWVGRKATSITHPDRTFAIGPEPSRAAIGRRSSRSVTGGVEARCAAGAKRSRRSARAIPSSHPAAMISRGRGRTPARPIRRMPRAVTVRVGSAWARAPSIIRPKGTPLGHAASQARQARHSSIIRVNEASTVAWPSSTARIAAIRPRGEAVSSPVSRKVGQCGRHSPHATHLTTSSSSGAGRLGSQLEVVTPTPASAG